MVRTTTSAGAEFAGGGLTLLPAPAVDYEELVVAFCADGPETDDREEALRFGTDRLVREVELGIAPGQRATVYVMAQPSRPLRGQVDSLGWGVASDVSATFGGPPHVERTLNWVRIAARFPLRILLDAPPDDLMRYGTTAVIVIDK